MKTRSKIIIALTIIIIIIIASVAVTLLSGPSDVEKAPDFTLVDIDGNEIKLSNITDKIVILDFMFIDCGSCKIAEKSLKEIYPKFEDEIHIISIDGVDNDTELQDHRDEAGINFDNWTFARDAVQSEGSYVAQIYNVYEYVTIYIIDKDGYATYHKIGGVSSAEFEEAINKAILGTSPILVQQMSIVVLAIFAGIASFFSPCAFPMLPGYMAYFLGLQVGQKEEKGAKGLYRRAVFGGIAGGIGIISVYIIIGIIIITLGSVATPYIPLLGPIVGVILIILGILMFTNIQYHKIVRPFQILASKFSRKKKEGTEEESEKAKEDKKTKGFYFKLFRYGVGYGAAASACVAPLFIVLVITASAASITGTFLDGIIVLMLYALVVIGLMVGITLALTFFGQKATQKLSKYTEVIKKVSALVLIIVGVALIYFYFLAFG
ncbi:MAG: redoxin domain-containing protein [Thermoplasmata archaeon]|nr:MAG: redoxin domain-containing protein [Thermoplasmata archaeon]